MFNIWKTEGTTDSLIIIITIIFLLTIKFIHLTYCKFAIKKIFDTLLYKNKNNTMYSQTKPCIKMKINGIKIILTDIKLKKNRAH